MSDAKILLEQLNSKYASLHKKYETYFWVSYMGDRTVNEKKDAALHKLTEFRGSEKLKEKAAELAKGEKGVIKGRLETWVKFFEQYQIPHEAMALKKQIDTLESKIAKIRNSQEEGYIDPVSKKFVPASTHKMRAMMRTHKDEAIRKASYEALEKQAHWHLDEYVELIKLRNSFARLLGYEDFYDYNLRHIDNMTKDELFSLFGDIGEKTKGVFAEVRELAKSIKGLRKPWNFSYKMTGDFAHEEDQYFQFDQALDRWGRSFAAMGIDFRGGSLQLDLLDRKGKHNNGFCHWPDLVRYVDGKRMPGSSNFTCNVVPGQVGSGHLGYVTLFHEGGHAAHFLNTDQHDVCLNHEYAPMTAAWAETHSMFLDTAFSSIEWRTRYAKNEKGEAYPFELYEKIVRKTAVLRPWRILSIVFTADFERAVYELKEPTPEKIIAIAKKMHKRYFDMTEASLLALNIPHLYSWESACSYHGYGLAEIALQQWREYFYQKYGYVVDNPNIGKEMKRTWQWGASKSFSECVKEATGKKLSSSALIKVITQSPDTIISTAKKRLKKMESVPVKNKIDLKANIKMVHGKKTIATNAKGFDVMAEKYGEWVRKMAEENGK